MSDDEKRIERAINKYRNAVSDAEKSASSRHSKLWFNTRVRICEFILPELKRYRKRMQNLVGK